MYNKSDFEWIWPVPKNKLAITIPNEHDLNINRSLLAEIPERIIIGYIPQTMTLALCADDAGFTYPKSGSLKLPELIQKFTDQGMQFPARFTMKFENDMWVGTLNPQPNPEYRLKRPPRRKKVPDLESLEKEAGC